VVFVGLSNRALEYPTAQGKLGVEVLASRYQDNLALKLRGIMIEMATAIPFVRFEPIIKPTGRYSPLALQDLGIPNKGQKYR